MKVLGTQLTATQYEAFKAALATQLPTLRVQTINAAGKFAINGNLTGADAATIRTLYAAQSQAPVGGTSFDMLAYQSMERRQQTHKARAMRTARAFRFGR